MQSAWCRWTFDELCRDAADLHICMLLQLEFWCNLLGSCTTGSGTIDVKELRTALNALGQNPSDEELFVMISQVSDQGHTQGLQIPVEASSPCTVCAQGTRRLCLDNNKHALLHSFCGSIVMKVHWEFACHTWEAQPPQRSSHTASFDLISTRLTHHHVPMWRVVMIFNESRCTRSTCAWGA